VKTSKNYSVATHEGFEKNGVVWVMPQIIDDLHADDAKNAYRKERAIENCS
jgi:hypothetical protein